jgi:hypothetical protein
MAQFIAPPDFALNLREALRYKGDTRQGRMFYALVAAGAPWRAARVRELIRWGERRRVCVGAKGERYLTVVQCGFAGAGWRDRMVAAKAVLRSAAEDVAAGREPHGITGVGLLDWSSPPAGINPDDWWPYGSDTGRVHEATAAQIAELRRIEAEEPIPAPAPSAKPTRPPPGFAPPGARPARR